MGALSLTGQSKVQNGFGPILTDIEFIDANDKDSLIAVFDDKVCGFIAEPIQGEGGVLPLEAEFLELARGLCDEYDALMVLEQIHTGMVRTGEYFAYQGLGVVPDVLTMAKGLGGGFPIGAVLVTEKRADVFKPGMHGSTFGGNHLACAVAYEVIRIIESHRLLENTKKMSDYLVRGLDTLIKKHPEKLVSLRGRGLLLGLVMNDNINGRQMVEKGLSYGIVMGRAGENILRFAPPLTVRAATIDLFLERLDKMFLEL